MKPPFKYRVTLIFLELTRRLSFRGAWQLSGVLAFLFSRLKGRTQTMIRHNLDRAFPDLPCHEKTHLYRMAFRHTIAFALEAGSVWLKPIDYGIHAITRIEGLELFEQAKATGRGVILLLPHLGNWEMANQFIGPRAHVTALYKPHPNQALEECMHRARTRAGAHLVPTNRRGIAQLLKHLKRGGVTVILPDQVPDKKSASIQAPFFNQMADTQTLVPKLARSSGAVLLGLVCARDLNGGFTAHIYTAPDDIGHEDLDLGVKTMNKYIETLVEHDPAQYLWSYNRFKNAPA